MTGLATPPPPIDGPHAVEFGRRVLGPIYAEFGLRLWMAMRFVPRPDEAALLFCARGGLRLQLVYDRVRDALALDLPVAGDGLMVSRLVAARAALLQGSPGALDEILREFHGQSLGEVATALSGGTVSLPPGLAATRASLLDLALGDHEAGRAIRTVLSEQTELFRQHLADRIGTRRRVFLCDTGLYGSTIRLLREGVPEIEWSSVLFARSNYKRFDTAHFARTLGLSVERDGYSPLNPRTSILRFWHLVESSLEPRLDSVTWFEAGAAGPRSNLEQEGWRDRVAPEADEMLAGALAHIDGLRGQGRAPAAIFAEADAAWAQLKRAIIWPRGADVEALTVAHRSRDFGRTDAVVQFAEARGRLASVRHSLWREGQIAQTFPLARPILLAALEGVYAGRDAIATLKRRLRRR